MVWRLMERLLKCDCNWLSLMPPTINWCTMSTYRFYIIIYPIALYFCITYIGTDGSVSNIVGDMYNELHTYVCA